MTDRATIRSDVRLEDHPMRPVMCEACSATVEVSKSSWEQTSIQWDAHGVAACRERHSLGGDAPGALFTGCSRLGDSIRRAVERGDVSVQTEGSLPSNDEAHP